MLKDIGDYNDEIYGEEEVEKVFNIVKNASAEQCLELIVRYDELSSNVMLNSISKRTSV